VWRLRGCAPRGEQPFAARAAAAHDQARRRAGGLQALEMRFLVLLRAPRSDVRCSQGLSLHF
jgi:hypothetical protein